VAENNTLTPATVDEMGIEASSFEETIDKLNHISDEILFALEDQICQSKSTVELSLRKF